MNPLKALRIQAEISIEELAKRSNVAPNTISSLERGRSKAIPRTIIRLAKALNVPYEALAELETQEPPKAPAAMVEVAA